MHSETITLDGHIIDSLTLSKVLDLILRDGGQYTIAKFHIGATREDQSHAEIIVTAPDSPTLEHILHIIGQHGAARHGGEVHTLPTPANGVFPEGFYATTNLETAVHWGNAWRTVQNIEMDCGIVVGEDAGTPSVRCVPMHRVRTEVCCKEKRNCASEALGTIKCHRICDCK